MNIKSDVKIKIGDECPDCKIWNARYNINGELCPRCLGVAVRNAMQAFTKAYREVMKEMSNEKQ